MDIINTSSLINILSKSLEIITETIEGVFVGKAFSWRDNTLPVIENLDRILLHCGEYLPEVDVLQSMIMRMYAAMEKQDTYAFTDQLIGIEQYLQICIDGFMQNTSDLN